MEVILPRIIHPLYALLMFLPLGDIFIQGVNGCATNNDCFGYTCQDSKCICNLATASCEPIQPKSFSERCSTDTECKRSDVNLHCYTNEQHSHICRCKRLYNWDGVAKRCIRDIETDSYEKFDPIQNLVIPLIIVITILAMIYLGIKLFCNCGKMWRRRRSQLTRELEGMAAAAAASSPHQPATWVASYRVFSPLSNSNHHPMHPAPCLFLPGHGGIPISPPSYEEALKHKVILSSYHPNTSGGNLPLYSISASEVLPTENSILVQNHNSLTTRPAAELPQRQPRSLDDSYWTNRELSSLDVMNPRGNYTFNSFATIRSNGRNLRISQSHRLHPADLTRRETAEPCDQIP